MATHMRRCSLLPQQAERCVAGVLAFLSRVARCMGDHAAQPRGAVAAALCTALRCLEAAAARKSVASLLDRQVLLGVI